MPTLQAADAAAIRCRFVHDIYKYVKCLRYSVDCCLDDAKESFLDFKRSTANCELNDSEYCRLKDRAKDSLVVDCMTELPCESQAQIEVRVTETGSQYASTIVTNTYNTDDLPVTSSPARFFPTADSIIQEATLDVGVYDQSASLLFTHQFTSGSAKVSGTEVTDPIYALRATTYFDIDGVSTQALSYLRKVRIYYTDPLGQYVPNQFWDLDVSPITSPYLSGPGYTTVSASDLYFNSPNWTTAITTVLQNAMVDKLGHATNYMDVFASKPGNIDRVGLATRIKHDPTGYWAGLNNLDFRVEYFNSLKGLVVVLTSSSTPTPIRPEGGNIYGQHTFSLSCGNIDVELANSPITIPLNVASTRFNHIGLTSNRTAANATLQTYETLDCSNTVLQATVTSAQTITLVRWLNPALTVIGSGFTYTHSSALAPGTYTCRVTLSSGCVVDQEFEIT